MEEFSFPSRKTRPTKSGADVARAGKVANSPETRLRPSSDAADKAHSRAMARIQKMNDKGFSATLRKG